MSCTGAGHREPCKKDEEAFCVNGGQCYRLPQIQKFSCRSHRHNYFHPFHSHSQTHTLSLPRYFRDRDSISLSQ
uniref:Uncharacterized protein n=1 Tax=Eptatretus burgeri TaxID=7764 RepID=A0A8C4N9D3_EPTBU